MDTNDNNEFYHNNDQSNTNNDGSIENINAPQNEQQPTYEYKSEQVYSNRPQQPNQQHPDQQTQWTFNEYAPMGGSKKPKKPKEPKDGSNKGLKVFAVIISLLLVASISSFILYVFYGEDLLNGAATSSSEAKGDNPTLDITDLPKEDTNNTDSTGRMTTASVNKAVGPSVVGIVTYTKSAGYQVAGQGSGVIMSQDGYIVTNAHVVESENPRQPIAKIEIVLDNGETYVGKLLGADTKSDLAVVKIDKTGLKPAVFGNSDKLEVGETVIVIGNPSGLEFAGSLTQGVVSALNREVLLSKSGETMKYIQTDAAINPGNSGGALVNQFGQVVGISSAKIVAEGYEGMGFAIPINIAKPVIDSIVKNGYVKGRVKIGITYVPISETLAQLNGIPVGLRVRSFDETADVAKKGIQLGDIITKMDGKAVFDSSTIAEALKGKKPGDTIKLTIYRVDESERAKTFDISVILGEDIPVNTQ